jgi:hypothetical protein
MTIVVKKNPNITIFVTWTKIVDDLTTMMTTIPALGPQSSIFFFWLIASDLMKGVVFTWR